MSATLYLPIANAISDKAVTCPLETVAIPNPGAPVNWGPRWYEDTNPYAPHLELFMPPVEPVESNPQQDGGRNPLYDARAEAPWETTTADPFQKPLEVLERWDNKTYTVVLQKKLVIYNDRNIYGKIPFLSIGWWDTPGSFWSMGLGRTSFPASLNPSWRARGHICRHR